MRVSIAMENSMAGESQKPQIADIKAIGRKIYIMAWVLNLPAHLIQMSMPLKPLSKISLTDSKFKSNTKCM
jgi:hypothetical protein